MVPQLIKFNTVCLLFMTLISCNQSQNFNRDISENKVEVFNIPEERTKGMPDFEKFVDQISIIPLETTNESIFGKIFQLIFLNNKYFVFDRRQQELFVFNHKGKFLFKMDKRGRGPQEYLEMRDVKIDEKGAIHILNAHYMAIYDQKGSFLKRVPFTLPENYHINPVNFCFSANGGYYLWSGSIGIKSDVDNQFACYKVNKAGVFTGDVYFPVEHFLYGSSMFSRIDKQRCFGMDPIIGNDTIYRFCPNSVYPKYYLDFGKRKLPSDFISEFSIGKKLYETHQNTKYVTSVHHFNETSSYLTFLHKSDKRIWVTLCSKATKNVICFDKVMTTNYFPLIKTGMGDKLIGKIAAGNLIKSLEDGSFKKAYGFLDNYQELVNIISNLRINDNEVIMKVTLKDN